MWTTPRWANYPRCFPRRVPRACDGDALHLDGTTLTIEVSTPREEKPVPPRPESAPHNSRQAPRSWGRADRIGEATIRSIIDALNDRGENPRGNDYGSFGDGAGYHG